VACFGLTGAATLPEVGTTYNDIQVGCLVLGALLALLLAAGADDARQAPRAARLRLLAGALGGCAVGLKLTAAVFPPALALAAAVAARGGAAARARGVGLLSLGGALGFTAAYGPWGWFLWERFGNPFGPFFNDVFRSPLFPPDGQRDLRFLPDGLAEALAYPLLWARRSEGVVLEPPLADPRFAVGLAALLLAVAAGTWRRLRSSGHLGRPGLPPARGATPPSRSPRAPAGGDRLRARRLRGLARCLFDPALRRADRSAARRPGLGGRARAAACGHARVRADAPGRMVARRRDALRGHRARRLRPGHGVPGAPARAVRVGAGSPAGRPPWRSAASRCRRTRWLR
jgi:hypothetical protein